MSTRIQLPPWLAAASLVTALGIGGLTGWILATKSGNSGRLVPLFIAGESHQVTNQVSFGAGFRPVVKVALPAVVNISSQRIIRFPPSGPSSPLFGGPFFRQFYGDEFFPEFGVPRQRREQGLGSGVIVSPSGYILTNHHVVQGASEIEVFLADLRRFKARIVGTDPRTDIAVLKVEEKSLPVLALGDSSQVEVGDFALAIGNPFGVGETVTMGIVGAKGRGGLNPENYEDFIQTDAAINPGNSGGALLNIRGELIGINTAIISGGGGNQGIGFAVPSNMARGVMEQILKQGKVTRGYLGISIQDVTPELAASFKLPEARGVLVGDVTPDSPAARAGIARGDVITEVNGERVNDARSLRLRIAQATPDSTVRLKLLRDGREREVSVKLAELPAEAQRQPPIEEEDDRSSALEGVSVSELTPQIARQLNLPLNVRGVVVTRVQSSAAADAGLRRGDVIQEVNRRPVASVADFEQAIRQAGNQPVVLLVNRRGSTSFIAIEPQ
jgi:serine protease Do